MKQVVGKKRLNFTGLHGISQKAELFIVTAVRTSSPKYFCGE
jgi:hypothetical protein